MAGCRSGSTYLRPGDACDGSLERGGKSHDGRGRRDVRDTRSVAGELPRAVFLCDPRNDYQYEWYNARGTAADANLVTVNNTTVVGINAHLASAGRTGITGHITDSTTGDPISSCLSAHSLAPDGSRWLVSQANTDANGYYELRGLRAGTYSVYVESCDGKHVGSWARREKSRVAPLPIWA